jgi:hypothetical protein
MTAQGVTMTDDQLIDPVEIQNRRPDRDHVFRNLIIHESIVKLNEIVDNQPSSPKDDEYWDRLKRRMASFESALVSISKAIDKRDLIEIRKSICKSEIALHDFAHVSSLPLERDMEEVTQALLTQFCTNDYDLDATVDHYNDQGIETYLTKDESTGYSIVRSSKSQTAADGKIYSKGDRLRSVFYRKPEFHSPFK